MTINEGVIHALVGENGSGKSTLVKCLAGVHQAEEGQLYYKGEVVELPHPLVAREYGVATIFQEFSLVPTLSVAENIFLGRQLNKTGGVGLAWKEMQTQTLDILDRLSISIDPEIAVRDLSVAEQQLVEIVKAISTDSTLLIMDEPTAALGLSETRRLHELIKQLSNQGKAILYISHRLDEVFQIADHITVLKDGRRVGDERIENLEAKDVIRMMVGFDIAQHYPKEENATEELCLEVRNLSTETGVQDVSFDIRKGEVFGLGGMVGSKRTDIALGLFGFHSLTAGEILIEGKKVSLSSPSDAIRAGI
ncbi:MAG: sugar ABC transporter ATP-binding protein, partial [Anaerolineales bacterium]